ncbi:hypothetical protein [Acinetobacter sp.]|uniref:hypothetical protein n=1 Tax=Acinetobacter sp. TaxID=472 RepID=UPI00388ECE6C
MNADFNTRFLTDTDETGRFIVSSHRTGAKYYVEVIIGAHTPEWGSIDPATGNLMHKKGDGKYTGGIKDKESMITKENGFEKIHMLGLGESPHAAIERLDAMKPDRIAT